MSSKNTSPLLSVRPRSVLASRPLRFVERLLVLTPGAATEYDRDTDRSCWSPLSGFMQRAHTTAGSDGSSLEDLFHLVVVILIETANLLRLFCALQLSVHVAILRTVAGLDAQATTVAVCYGTGVGSAS